MTKNVHIKNMNTDCHAFATDLAKRNGVSVSDVYSAALYSYIETLKRIPDEEMVVRTSM